MKGTGALYTDMPMNMPIRSIGTTLITTIINHPIYLQQRCKPRWEPRTHIPYLNEINTGRRLYDEYHKQLTLFIF